MGFRSGAGSYELDGSDDPKKMAIEFDRVRDIGELMPWAYKLGKEEPMLEILSTMLHNSASLDHQEAAAALAIMLAHSATNVVRYECTCASCNISVVTADRFASCIDRCGSSSLPFNDGSGSLALQLLREKAPLELHFNRANGALNGLGCQLLSSFLITDLCQKTLEVLNLSDNHIGIQGAE